LQKNSTRKSIKVKINASNPAVNPIEVLNDLEFEVSISSFFVMIVFVILNIWSEVALNILIKTILEK